MVAMRARRLYRLDLTVLHFKLLPSIALPGLGSKVGDVFRFLRRRGRSWSNFWLFI
jgi:hypothetical protein